MNCELKITKNDTFFLGKVGVYLNHCCIFVVLVTQLFLAHIDISSALGMLRIEHLFTSVESFCSIGLRRD